MNIEEFSKSILEQIDNNKLEIVNLLKKIEDLQTIEYEIKHVTNTLQHLSVQEKFLESGSFNRLAVFMPINLPLYSLFLYAIIPGYMFKKVYIKCNTILYSVILKIIKLLKLEDLNLSCEVINTNREVFLEGYAAASDVIVFTGQYKNVTNIIAKLPKKIIIYFGYGINPIIILDNTNLKSIADTVIKSRTFNNGRDCMAPDCILVRKSICNEFIDLLISKLKILMIGTDNLTSTIPKSLSEKKQINIICKYIISNKNDIVWGCQPNLNNLTVNPLILKRNISKINIIEFFSPVFNIFYFNRTSEIKKLLQTKEFDENSMYTVVFSGKKIDQVIQPNHVVTFNVPIENVDDGNQEFGGYGKKVNFIYNNGVYTYGPILISKKLYNIKHGKYTQATRSK